MKLTALQRQAPEPAVALTVGLLQAIGADDFAGLLLRAIGAVLPVSHCTVFALRSSGRVERVSTASAVGESHHLPPWSTCVWASISKTPTWFGWPGASPPKRCSCG